jgi:hypothetical protein
MATTNMVVETVFMAVVVVTVVIVELVAGQAYRLAHQLVLRLVILDLPYLTSHSLQ